MVLVEWIIDDTCIVAIIVLCKLIYSEVILQAEFKSNIINNIRLLQFKRLQGRYH